MPKTTLISTNIILLAIILILVSTVVYLIIQPSIEQIASAPSAEPVITPAPTAAPGPATTPSPTANWKTYNKHGFSFKYPSTWRIAQDTVKEENATGYDALIVKGDEKQILTVWKNPLGFGLEGVRDIYDAQIMNGKIKINSKRVADSEGFPFGEAGIFSMEYGDNHYTITYDFNLKNRASELELFEQILSTFKFTK